MRCIAKTTKNRRCKKYPSHNIFGNLYCCKHVFHECPICLENCNHTNITKTACNHVFHKDCLAKWLRMNNKCPMCKCMLYSKIYCSSESTNIFRDYENDFLY